MIIALISPGKTQVEWKMILTENSLEKAEDEISDLRSPVSGRYFRLR